MSAEAKGQQKKNMTGTTSPQQEMGAGLMSRSRPYDGQPHTDHGIRGATEIRGITFRDLRDAYVRAWFLASSHIHPELYEEARKGEAANLHEGMLFGWDINRVDPVAVAQNLTCEIERLMGIYPNVPDLRAREVSHGERGSVVKREIMHPRCAAKIRVGVADGDSAIDVALAHAQGEHTKFVAGECRRWMTCDFCGLTLPEGTPGVAVSMYSDARPYFPWEDEYIAAPEVSR